MSISTFIHTILMNSEQTSSIFIHLTNLIIKFTLNIYNNHRHNPHISFQNNINSLFIIYIQCKILYLLQSNIFMDKTVHLH